MRCFQSREGALVAFMVAGVVLGGGCAGDLGDVNRVQPAAIRKSDITNKSWYYRQTVVDAPETLGPYATIGTGDLFTIERVRFEIQEDYIIAHKDYEYVPGSESCTFAGADCWGPPVAAFAITKHFDIIREYNPQTGEESNVITENDSDRPWHEREYMRIDWSKNVLQRIPFLIYVEYFDTNTFYIDEDQSTNPYRARIEPENGYMDFVVNHGVIPDFYTCYVTYEFQYTSCGHGEVLMRHAFWEVDEEENANYEILNYPDSVVLKDADGNEILDPATGEVKREGVFERFGFYRLDRKTYDNYRGLVESGRLYNIIRFNIWEDSVDDNGELIPYAQRTPKPIVYYLNWNFPADLVDTAREVAGEWNRVFRTTVASLHGKTVDDPSIPDMFQLFVNSCNVDNLTSYLNGHDSVREKVEADMRGFPLTAGETLDNWCAATEYHSRALDDRFVWQQNGDPRFNMMYWIPEALPSGWSGYGPMLGDPVTGRTVNANAYIMGWTIESAATRTLEYIDYMNGDICADRGLTEGVDCDALETLLAGSNLPPKITAGGYDPMRHTASIDRVEQLARRAPTQTALSAIDQRFHALGSSPEELLVELENGDHFQERLNRVYGTALEREWLITPQDLMLASQGTWDGNMTAVTDELWNAASFTQVRAKAERREATERLLQEHTMCPVANLDDSLVGLAKELKGKPREERRQILRSEIFKAVMLHEVGHNVGLRHNFEGSYDALNYPRTYWDIETNTGLSDEQKLDARQPEYRYSSIMDYHGRVNVDFQGLAPYDYASIKFGYGQLVETFADTSVAGGSTLRAWRFANDYKKLPAHIGSVQAMYDRVDVPFDPYDPPAHEVPYMFCSDEYANATPTCKRRDFGANQRELMQAAIVQYKNYFIFSNFLRNRLTLDFSRIFTRGYSTFREVLLTFQYMYFYRAQDPEFFFNTDLGPDMFMAVTDGLNLLGEVLAMPEPGDYYRCVERTTDEVAYFPPSELRFVSEFIDYGEDNPAEPADSSLEYDCNIHVDTDGSFTPEAVLALGDSQPLFLGFTDDSRLYWTFSYLGTFWDKLNALQAMADATARFFRVSADEDPRAFSVSPYRVFDKQLLRVFDNVVRGRWVQLASTFTEVLDQSGEPNRSAQHHVPVAGMNLVADPSTYIDLDGDPLDPAPPPAGAVKIYAPGVATIQRQALILGNALMTSPLDDSLDFGKHSKVYLKGAVDDFGAYEAIEASIDSDGSLSPAQKAAAKEARLAECNLSSSGHTYRAIAVPDGASIGYDMVRECATWAQRLADRQAALVVLQADLAVAEANLDTALANNAPQATIDALEQEIADIEAEIFRLDPCGDVEGLCGNIDTDVYRGSILQAEEELASLQQQLQFSRLVHLVFDPGARL